MTEIKPGDRVLCRTANGEWWETTAHSGAHITSVKHGAHWSVRVGPWGDIPSVNWPAEDVKLAVGSEEKGEGK